MFLPLSEKLASPLPPFICSELESERELREAC